MKIEPAKITEILAQAKEMAQAGLIGDQAVISITNQAGQEIGTVLAIRHQSCIILTVRPADRPSSNSTSIPIELLVEGDGCGLAAAAMVLAQATLPDAPPTAPVFGNTDDLARFDGVYTS